MDLVKMMVIAVKRTFLITVMNREDFFDFKVASKTSINFESPIDQY